MAHATDTCPQLLQDWLARAVESGASDLHLIGGHPPVLRLHGVLQQAGDEPLAGELVESVLTPLCTDATMERFRRDKNVDFSYELTINGEPRRFRINMFLAGGLMGSCMRVIPREIPGFQWAGFPRTIAERLAGLRNGLVLITGVAGAGKTTSLAMIINLLNMAGGRRIITIEEPVEYLYPKCSSSVVTQREVGLDVDTFADGLKYGLRQDPDVILVGEIRDNETAQIALTAAETGHLVFSTLHARDAKGAISRYADVFPQNVQNEIRAQMSMSLRAVICQHLLPGTQPNEKRELALEIMFNNIPIASAIRLGKIESIDTNILTGRADGMVTLNESIKQLLQSGRISQEVADRVAGNRSFRG